VRSETYLFCLE